MSHFLHMERDSLVSFYLLTESPTGKRFQWVFYSFFFYFLSDLFGFTAATCCIRARPDATRWIIKHHAFKRYHFNSFFLCLSILPASCRPLGELLNSRTFADVIVLFSFSLCRFNSSPVAGFISKIVFCFQSIHLHCYFSFDSWNCSNIILNKCVLCNLSLLVGLTSKYKLLSTNSTLHYDVTVTFDSRGRWQQNYFTVNLR